MRIVLENNLSYELKWWRKRFLNNYCQANHNQNSFASNKTNPASANKSRMSVNFTFVYILLLVFFKLSRK